ncbi:hypothetical protein H4R22_004255, partial [Coemansia sp. RSA 1290]
MASAEETRQLPQLFEQTSQYRHWRFTPEALEQLRVANNQQGIDRVLDGLGKEVQVEGSSETRITEASNNMLTPQEELQL